MQSSEQSHGSLSCYSDPEADLAEQNLPEYANLSDELLARPGLILNDVDDNEDNRCRQEKSPDMQSLSVMFDDEA